MAKKVNTTKSSSSDDKNKEINTSKARNLFNISEKLLRMSDDTYKVKSVIDSQSSRFDKIINDTLEVSKGIAGGNVLDFAQNIRNSNARYNKGKLSPNSNIADLRKIMTTSSGEIYSYFQEVYQNKYIEIADLKFISKFIPALGEAVTCLLDSITNSDDLSGTISRTIQPDSTMSKEDQHQLESIIERFEKSKELKLQKKLKNIVYKTALVSGKFYVYAISYADLFEQYSRDRAESTSMLNLSNLSNAANKNPSYRKAIEGYEYLKDGSLQSKSNGNILSMSKWNIAIENVNNAINTTELKSIVEEAKQDYLHGGESAKEKEEIRRALEKFESELSDRASTVKIIHSSIPEIVLDDMPAIEAYNRDVQTRKVNDPSYKGLFDSYFGSTPIDMETGVVSSSGDSKDNVFKAEKNFNVHGTYIRYIDPKNIIPVRLLGEVIGYYYIQSTQRVRRVTASTSNTNANILGTDAFSGAFNIGALNDQRKTSIIDSIVTSISDSICANFSKKFVAKNAEFKKAIADCITYNGFLDNEFHVQFLDPKNVIEFVINEDDEGNGESVLANSLFPAKLLLSLITARILNYLNNSGDKNIAHIAKGPIDVHTGRQTQRLIKNMQETKITFSDLLSTNLVFNKFSRNKNILLPKSKDGTNLVEFEVMEGQNIDMNPEYENKLEQMAILGTGVPSVIMEYIGQSDFAKGFETGNIKYASRVSSIQSDLEEPTTELYNMILQNEMMDEGLKSRLVGHFKIKLNRPKTLAVSNNNEYLGNLQQLLQLITQIMYGESASDEKTTFAKEEFTRLAAKEYAPYIDWKAFEDLKKQAQLKAADPNNTPNQANDMQSY